MNAPPLIEAQQLSAGHHGHAVFRDLSLRLHAGEIVALLGPNGCGKTTLIRTLAGLHAPQAGEIRLAGEPLARLDERERARRIGYVPQYHRTAFAYPVLDMVLMGRLAGRGLMARPSRADREAALDALATIGAEKLADRPYTELSGGQRQLVLIARALAQDAPCLILDEPANNLDYGNQRRLLERIRALASARHAILMSTHHPEHAAQAATRAILMKEGRLLADGPSREVLTRTAIALLYDLPEPQTDLRGVA